MAKTIIMLIKQLDGHLCFVTKLPPEQKWIMGEGWSIWILMWAVLSMGLLHDAGGDGVNLLECWNNIMYNITCAA